MALLNYSIPYFNAPQVPYYTQQSVTQNAYQKTIYQSYQPTDGIVAPPLSTPQRTPTLPRQHAGYHEYVTYNTPYRFSEQSVATPTPTTLVDDRLTGNAQTHYTLNGDTYYTRNARPPPRRTAASERTNGSRPTTEPPTVIRQSEINPGGTIIPKLAAQVLLQAANNTSATAPSMYPNRPLVFKKVEAATKTSVHPILDYDETSDDYEYYDDDTGAPIHVKGGRAYVSHVTPIQGPIVLKNNATPVVPLYSYPMLSNGSYVQIPIFWTALSIAFGLELQGEIIRGVPCIKKHHQLYCPAAGDNYPIDRIELFIDENKALVKRMFGEFNMMPAQPPPDPSFATRRFQKRAATKNQTYSTPLSEHTSRPHDGTSYFEKMRRARQAPPPDLKQTQTGDSGRIDSCESKVEIITPYWASNSAGKLRAIVNTQHFEQAIHQEVCSKTKTKRCANDCGCEQKYKWHRLLAYDADDDCRGIFMDWFLFPSCCVCRCDPK